MVSLFGRGFESLQLHNKKEWKSLFVNGSHFFYFIDWSPKMISHNIQLLLRYSQLESGSNKSHSFVNKERLLNGRGPMNNRS